MAPVLLVTLFFAFFLYGHVGGCELQYHICKESNRTCEECIRADVCCSWIYEKDYKDNRCTSKSFIPENIDKVLLADPSYYKTIQNSNFANTDPTMDTPAVQIAPQRIKVYLRHGDPINITLTYKAAMNYPLDLYYLMDLTHSMKSHHEHMVKLGNKMKDKLVGMTELYKIGFGFYSDKVLMPYSAMTPKYLNNPCVNENLSCEKGFNFKHALNFTSNFEDFKEKVNTSRHTANNDDLEGGFDAIMQILLCQEEVQWRRISRKIIIVATDGFMHTSGDGILAGTTRRNVNKCLLVKDGDYMVYDGTKYDYPSLEEIYRKLKKSKVNILFAVKNKESEHDNKIMEYYTQMVEVMDGISQAGNLTDDPENILKMVEDAYMSIVKQVSFSLKTNNKYVNVKFFSSCKPGDIDGPLMETSMCGDINIGEEYKFIVNLELMEIPNTNSITDSIEIEEKNIEETLKIDIEYTEVSCNCESEENFGNVPHGEFKCGKYNCHPGWIGETCDKQCDRSSGRHKTENFTSLTCYKRGEFDEDTCKCICDPEYIGTYCEFRQCGRNKKGDLCSNHGVCNNGNCECFENYDGKVCDCYTATDVCIAPNGEDVCSGHGECKCGKCVCESYDYKGQFCEGCKSCETLCDNYKSAVIAANNGSREEINTNFKLNKVNELNITEHSIQCLTTFFLNDDDCKIFYTYEVQKNASVYIEHRIVCTKIVNYAQLGGAVFAIVVGLLIILLCMWKVRVNYLDKKEYEAYQKNLDDTYCTELNPLYKHPVTLTENPTYTGDSYKRKAQ